MRSGVGGAGLVPEQKRRFAVEIAPIFDRQCG
jgi:hypothetical protein